MMDYDRGQNDYANSLADGVGEPLLVVEIVITHAVHFAHRILLNKVHPQRFRGV